MGRKRKKLARILALCLALVLGLSSIGLDGIQAYATELNQTESMESVIAEEERILGEPQTDVFEEDFMAESESENITAEDTQGETTAEDMEGVIEEDTEDALEDVEREDSAEEEAEDETLVVVEEKAIKKSYAANLNNAEININQPVSGAVVVNQNENYLQIGNNNISRVFRIDNNKLRTGKIFNWRGDSTFTPAEGSEEFAIYLLGDDVNLTPNQPSDTFQNSSVKSSENWSMSGNSVSTNGNDAGGYGALIDGNGDTFYHSRYNNAGDGVQALPVELTLDRGNGGTLAAVNTLGYQPRKGGGNGTIKNFEVYAADSSENLFNSSNIVELGNGDSAGNFNYVGTMLQNNQVSAWQYISLKEPCQKRYIGIKVLSAMGGSYASGAGIDLFTEKFDTFDIPSGNKATEIKASDLTIQSIEESNAEDAKGKLVTMSFEDVDWGTGEASIVLKITMDNDSHYMRKWVEIKLVGDSPDKTKRIAYIDGEHLYTTPSVADLNEHVPKNSDTTKDIIWTIPPNSGAITNVNEERADLGQPVYINGLFMGSEFPAAENKILKNNEKVRKTEGPTAPEGTRLAYARYYTGKNFTDFERDTITDQVTEQLTEDGRYISWPTVMGASRTDGSKHSVVQQDFYAYIREIATPSNFRIQYNVWYDGMQRITGDSVMKSFQDMEKAMTSTGVRPLDAYVIDDGWQQTRLRAGHNPQPDGYIGRDDGSPLSINTSGFWDWNNKFPYKFFSISGEMLNRGSNTGIWMSPRGGYASANPLREVIVSAGNGSSAYGDSGVDCADTRYVKKFAEYAKEMTRDYGINYWKWDAFLTNGVFNNSNFGEANLNVASYHDNNKHMVGGPNQIYFYTDMWEKWIGIMQGIRDYAETVDSVDNVWISNTCYINLSPWFLQWNNSIWLQCQGDRGMVKNDLFPDDQMNGMLTYRDAIYYDFINNHQFQFPLTNIFNHDPIYAPTDTGITANSMDGDKFRNYLYMIGTRGTALYELQYSKSVFNDEKYAVNADFLEWEEGNFDIIKNAIMIGKSPDSTMGVNNSAGANAQHGGKQAADQYAYGFSCFNGDEGIISMRNPDDANSVITFTIDEEIGAVSSDNNEYYMWLDHYYLTNKDTEQLATFSINDSGNYSPLATDNKLVYGQKITVNLKPGETQIWHLSKSADTVKPYIDEVYFTADNKIKVKTSEHVRQQGNESISFTITTVNEPDEATNTFVIPNENITALADMRTFELSLGTLLQDGQIVTVKMLNACDYSGNTIDDTGFTKKYYNNNTIVERTKSSNTSGIVSSAGRSIEGNQGFSVSIDLQYKGEAKLLSQADSYTLGIDSEGKPYFTVFGVTAKAKEALKLDQECTLIGVRENNGFVRIYVDGDIRGTGYNTSTIREKIKKADIKYSFGSNIVTALKICDTALAYDEMPESNLAKLIAMVEAADKSQFTTDSWNSANIDALLIQAKEAEALHNNEKATEIYEQLKNAFYSLEIGEGQAINVLSGLAGTVALVDSNASTSGFEFVNAQRPITNITDGNITLNNYTQFGKENENVPAYLQYDLGRKVELDSAKLWRYWDQGRQYTETALVVSETADFEKVDVLFYSGGEPDAIVEEDIYQLKSKLKDGKELKYTHSLYSESDAGKDLYTKSGEEPIVAKYVRLYVQGYKANNSGHMNHIIELQLFGTAKDTFGTEELEAIIREAEEKLESGDYSEEEAATLRGLIESAQKYLGENAEAPSSLGDIKSLVDSISNAIKNLPDKSIVDPDPTPENPDPDPDNPDPEPEDPKPSDAVPEHFEPVIRNPHTDETDVEEGERIEYDTDYHYTGQAITPAVEIWDNGVKLVAGVDYSISYKNNKNAWVDKSDERFTKYTGNYNEKNRPKIIITGKGNYATKKEIYFNILPQDITKLVPEESRVLIQKGKSAPAPVIYNNGTKLAAKKDYTLGNSEGNVTVTGTGNYTGSIVYKVIQKSSLKEVSALKITIDAKDLKYEGNAIDLLETGRLVIKNGNNILDSETIQNNLNISYVGNDRAGKATVVISAKDNNEAYYGSVSKTFAISGTDLKEIFKNVSFAEAEKFQGAEYPITFKNMGETNKERFKNVAVIKYPNSEQPIELKEGVRGHYIATYKNNAKVGTATVTLTGTGKDGVVGKTTLKYNIVAPETTETPDSVGVYASVAQDVEYTKNGAIPSIEVVYTNDARTKIILSKGVDYTVAYNKLKIKDVGQTEAVVTFKGNYKGISNWTLYYNVVHRSIKTVSMIAADMEEGKNFKNSLAVTLTDVNGKKLSVNSDYILSYSIDGGEQWYAKLPAVQSVNKADYDNKIQVKAQGAGGYSEEQIFTVHIGAKNYSFAKAKFDKIKKSYTGKEILFSEEEVNKLVTFGSAKEKVPFVGNVENELATVGISENNQSKDGYYIVSYINNTNKGNMLVVLRGTGKYYGSKTLSIPIQAKTMNDLKNPGNWNWGEQLLNLLK